MRRFWYVMLCSTAFLLVLTPAVGFSAEVAGPVPKTMLWKVQDAASQFYLFGTISLATPDRHQLPREVQSRFAGADVLVLGTDPGSTVNEDLQHKLVLSALYPPEDSLSHHLSKQAYDEADLELQRLGYSIDQFGRSKPWFLAMSINVLVLQQLGLDAESSFEREFAERAREGKTIVELEPFAERIRLLNSLSDREQELFLLYTMREMAMVREESEGLIQAWRTGDANRLEQFFSGILSAFPEARQVYDKLYTQQHRVLADRMEQLLESEENCFIVIEAARLVGPEGILELLKRRGYRVEQQ